MLYGAVRTAPIGTKNERLSTNNARKPLGGLLRLLGNFIGYDSQGSHMLNLLLQVKPV